MPAAKPINPFYVALLPVGVLFVITVCVQAAATVRGLHPGGGAASPLMALMDRHGFTIIGVELAVLTVLTIAAISSDDYWTRRFEARKSPEQDLTSDRIR